MNKRIVGALYMAAALGIGYVGYRKFLATPVVAVDRIDWLREEANLSVRFAGRITVTKGTSVNLGRGYTVEFFESYSDEVGKLAATAVVLKKDGAIVKYIANR